MSGRHCIFKAEWKSHPDFSDWIRDVKDQPQRAYCTVCRKSFDVANMGIAALRSHSKGQSHIKAKARTGQSCKLTDFLGSVNQPEKETAPEKSTPQASSTSQTPAPVTATSTSAMDTLNAEVLWAMKVVMSHYSMNSCEGVAELFATMFPDSNIAKRFTCAPTKCAYLIRFGLAPYFKNKLVDAVREAACYTISFDESLNKVSQTGQMDIVVRFWNSDDGRVSTRYLGSQFLGHATAADLLTNFKTGTKELDPKKMLQVSMDGPSVNWKFLAELREDRQVDPSMPQLIEIGSCGLHVIHGAFQLGAEATKWKIGQKLRAFWQLLHDSPARRDDYIRVTGSSTFPKKFCSHRWVEDLTVAERAIEVMPNIATFIDSYKTVPKSKVPTSTSFALTKEAREDKMFVSKLEFFASVAKHLEPFLNKFQTSSPMVPFLAEELLTLIKTLMTRFVKPEILTNASTATKMMAIDLTDEHVLVGAKAVDLGFAAKQRVKKLVKEKAISELQVMEFQMECRKFLMKTTSKIVERCPLRYPLVVKLRSLDPRYIIANPKGAIKKFDEVLETLANSKFCTASQCETISSQYKVFMQECPRKKLEYEEFGSKKLDRVDEFFSEQLEKRKEYSALWDCIKRLLTLSHGQADVERGFSVNNAMLAENMKEESFVAHRLVYDAVTALNCPVSKVPITKDLVRNVKAARIRYTTYLEDQKKETMEEKKSQKRKLIQQEINDTTNRKKRLVCSMEVLEKEADELAKKAEKQQNFTLLSKSNAFRLTVAENKKEVMELDKIITHLQSEYKLQD